MRRAVIDIGTNTVKLLVADVVDGAVLPVAHRDVTTRLGEGVQQSHRLAPAAMARTVAAITRYVGEARALGATDVIALTTSATRSATNAVEFLAACPLPVEVVSGEREAELIFRGVASDPSWANDRLLVMDVGGGSAEWIVGQAGKVERALSLPVGAVRMQEQFGDNFAGLMAHLRTELGRGLPPFRAGSWRLIGTGGTLVTLAQVARLPVDHARFTLDELRVLVTRLNALPLAERRRVPGLPPERADIIVAGGAVFVAALETLGAGEITVSVRALRFGALLTER
jgi:exopolyphosphatase/guanosine-5'-triphosphate,3'-diphosphate pyrophosphatase